MKNSLNSPLWYICALSGLADAGSKIHLYVGDKLCVPIVDFIFISYCPVPDSCFSDGIEGSKAPYAVTVCVTSPTQGWEKLVVLQCQSTLLFTESKMK